MKLQLFFLFIILTMAHSCTNSKQMIRSDFTDEGVFTEGIEGPATDYKGNIYAVNYGAQGTIGKVAPDGKTSLFLTLPEGSIGNGIRFGNQDQMFIADYTNHNVLQVDMNTKKIEVFAHEPKANQPNDIAIAPDKTLYASDPNWAEGTGKLWKVTKEKGFELLEENMGTTNGVEVSPDGKKLYVNESVQRNVWSYDILADGTLTNKQLFASFKAFGMDGMRCDNNGNLFICRYDKGTVAVVSPQGVLLTEIQLQGKKPTNITFSNDYSNCYITLADRGCIEIIERISI
ncbi:SMP-30/gluconolactonase/LRE family protein [Spongiimicrobium salis]|uniref:SMP-30/gluconolactonase/LRE family protein n=1 Tax=Spongiimicrobium salis TaxID=1667022 RepID=UPI00374D7D17